MKKSKGFTLIELLAIIVILAIIAVITVPLILNIIDDSKKGTIKDSVYGYKDAIDKYYVSELYKNNNSNLKLNGVYSITDKGELSDGENTYKIPFSGTAPTGGNLTYENNILKNGCITMNEYKATIENGEVTNVEKGNCGELTPQVAYTCIRATEKHKEVCNSEYGCASSEYGSAYDIGETIEYGRLGAKGEELVSGDAFDCDVNGDKNYDPKTERFYYVSDLFDTTTKEFDSDYAVLIYYSNTVGKEINNTTTITYDNTHGVNQYNNSINENWHGPLTAITHLPTTSDWKNVSLKNPNRQILNNNNETITRNGDNSTNELPIFSYEGYATRFLTTQELKIGCKTTTNEYGVRHYDCEYMFENTYYTNDTFSDRFFLENPVSHNNYLIYSMDLLYRSEDAIYPSSAPSGVRPVIEVKKTSIDY